MTSGVYPRKPGARVGHKPKFTADQGAAIKAGKAHGQSTKFLSAKWLAHEQTIRHVLNGTGAYKESK